MDRPVHTDPVHAFRGGRMIALAVIVAALVACGGAPEVQEAKSAPEPASGGIPWPAPSDPLDLAVAAGLEPTTHEFLDFHVHAHLDVFVNGSPVEVPAGIGIDIEDPAVHTMETELGQTYGGIEPPCAQPCISPLHTHATDGILHTESAVDQPNTLGQFFTEWGVELTDTCVGGYCSPGASIQVFVNGEPNDGDPAQIQLMDRLEIAIVIGSPPEEVPSTFPEA
jgi:hypothetical protein